MKKSLLMTIIIFIFIFNSCAKNKRAHQIPEQPKKEDSQKIQVPKQTIKMDRQKLIKHLKEGNKLLKKKKFLMALEEFSQAEIADPEHAPVYFGESQVHAHLGQEDKAIEVLKKSKNLLQNQDEETIYYTLLLHFLSIKTKNWDAAILNEAENAYYNAIARKDNDPEPDFHMGLIYEKVFMFDKAKKLFIKVIHMNKDFASEANAEIMAIKRIEQGKEKKFKEEIALISKMTRGDIAYLFIKELKVNKFLERHHIYDKINIDEIIDIRNHPKRAYIKMVVALDIKRLKPYQNGTFQPEMPINRGEFAMMIEDIIVRAKKDRSLLTSYFMTQSPFVDIRNTHQYFNAAMLCTSKNILTVSQNGKFNAMEQVSGAEALLAIGVLKKILN